VPDVLVEDYAAKNEAKNRKEVTKAEKTFLVMLLIRLISSYYPRVL